MKIGESIYTPRFCTVRVTAISAEEVEARRCGYTEPTYYKGEYTIGPSAQAALAASTPWPQRPFWNQYQHETGWTEEDIAEYHHLKAAASEVTHLQQNYP